MWGAIEQITMIRLVFASLIIVTLLLYLISTLIHSNRSLKNIIAYCKESGYTMQDLENDFMTADILGNRIRCGCRWIYYMNELGYPDVAEINNIESIEFSTEADLSSNDQTYIYCYMKNKVLQKVPSSKENYNELKAKLEKFALVKFS